MPRASLQVKLLRRRDVLGGAVGMGALGMWQACAPQPKGGDSAGGGDSARDTYEPIEILPITPNEDFYVTSCCGTPEVDTASWTVTFADRGRIVGALSLAQLEALPARDKEHTLECIGASPTNQRISNAVWSGLPLTEVFAAVGLTVPAEAVEIKFTSVDGFSTSLPLSDLDLPIWLVWRMNGVALPPAHGFPARMLVPGRYGMKNAKWLAGIELVDSPYLGFWETYGWSNDATYKPNALIRSPGDTYLVPTGTIRIVGTAFAGRDPIATVEVSVDGGGTWTAATFDYSPGPDVWTLWHLDWEATPGTWDIVVRCVTASGAATLPDPDGSRDLTGYDGSMAITVYCE